MKDMKSSHSRLHWMYKMTITELIDALMALNNSLNDAETINVTVSTPSGRQDIVSIKYDRNYEEVVCKLKENK